MPSLSAFAAPDRSIVDQLRRAPVFASLPGDSADCFAVLRRGAVLEVPAGVEVVSPGDLPALIVVTAGGLYDAGGSVAWPAGGCVGVAESLAGRRFASALRTVSPTLLYRLEAEWVQPLLRRCPGVSRCLLAALSPTSGDHPYAQPAFEGNRP